MEGILNDSVMRDWGLHKRGTSDVLVYSMGAIDEGHGPALQRDNDDLVARRSSVNVCESLGLQCMGHLPFSSDRVGEIARDWCPAFMEPNNVIEKLPEYIKADMESWPNPVTHVVVISGHGGNNFIKDNESEISKSLGIPFLYIPSFNGCSSNHKKFGKITVGHADHGEHSVAAYMGILNQKALDEINSLAKNDIRKAIESWKPLSGLSWYVLYGGDKYEKLRNPEYGLSAQSERFLKERFILADPSVGRELFDQNMMNIHKEITSFLKR